MQTAHGLFQSLWKPTQHKYGLKIYELNWGKLPTSEHSFIQTDGTPTTKREQVHEVSFGKGYFQGRGTYPGCHPYIPKTQSVHKKTERGHQGPEFWLEKRDWVERKTEKLNYGKAKGF